MSDEELAKLYEKRPGFPHPVISPEVFITEESSDGTLGEALMPQLLQNQSSIRSSSLELKFIGPIANNTSVLFHLVSESFETGVIPLELSLSMYYEMTYQTRRPGGMYLFNPMYLDLDETDIVKRFATPYTEYLNGTVTKTEDGQGEMILYFAVSEDIRQLACWEEDALNIAEFRFGYQGRPDKDCYQARRVQVILKIEEKADFSDLSETIRAQVEMDRAPKSLS